MKREIIFKITNLFLKVEEAVRQSLIDVDSTELKCRHIENIRKMVDYLKENIADLLYQDSSLNHEEEESTCKDLLEK